jgi:hypothetical protein
MTPASYTQCASYGPGWTMLVIFASALVVLGLGLCLLFKWILDKQYASSRVDQRDMRAFTASANEMMQGIRSACDRCHVDVVSKVKGDTGAAVDKIITTARSVNERMVTLLRENNKDIITAIGRIKANNEDLLRAVQRDNDISRSYAVTPTPVFGVSLQVTPPPVLGVGSQVRDSAAPLPHLSSGRSVR